MNDARRHGRSRAGVASVEMLLSLMPLMVMFMAVTQFGFLSVAHLVVRHAAQRGLRSAIVVLEDAPDRYDGSSRGAFQDAHAASGRAGFASAVSADLQTLLRKLREGDTSRLAAIRAAVYLPLVVIAPAFSQLEASRPALRETLDHGAAARFGGALLYNMIAAAVTFPQASQSNTLRTAPYGPTDEITLRVTYLFKCEVPIAAQLMCDRLYVLDLLHAQSPAMNELAHVELPALRRALYAGGGYYATIRAEATLPNQGARYYERGR